MRQTVRTLGIAAGAFALAVLSGCGSATETTTVGMPSPAVVNTMITDWPSVSQSAASAMIDKYGQPDEATATMLVWHDNGPWKRTIVYREEIQHNFPMPHKDVLEQFINYDVPVAAFDDLAAYDGSVIAERTKGEISARCDKEAANFLAINLANGIVTGQYTVDQARTTYAEQIKAMKNNQPAPLTERFVFEVPRHNINNPDHPAPEMQGMQ